MYSSFLLDVRISILSLKAITDSSLEPKPLDDLLLKLKQHKASPPIHDG
jgi:hypothetical protein